MKLWLVVEDKKRDRKRLPERALASWPDRRMPIDHTVRCFCTRCRTAIKIPLPAKCPPEPRVELPLWSRILILEIAR